MKIFNQSYRFLGAASAILLLLSVHICGAALTAHQSTPKADTFKLPSTPAGQTFGAFLEAFNSGNLETMKKFHTERGGNPENAQRDMEFYKRSEGLRPHHVIQSTDYKIEILVQTKTGDWLSFSMEVAQTAPYQPTGIRVQQASAPEK
jgi:hypothetical protein